MIREGIEYGVFDQRGAGISPENGQGLTTQTTCSNHSGCILWLRKDVIICDENIKANIDVRFAPKLVRDENGFRVCPRCRLSYGA